MCGTASSPSDADNLAVLTGPRVDRPDLKVLVSVGGWTGSRASRTRPRP
jgi:GH18 family chitinase